MLESVSRPLPEPPAALRQGPFRARFPSSPHDAGTAVLAAARVRRARAKARATPRAELRRDGD